MKIVILTTIILLFFQTIKSQIVINEICASNFRNYFDEDNDDPDWIELYNNSDQAVNLKNWKIFDKNEVDNAFILPDTIIEAKSRLVIFASGKNRYTANKLYVETTGMGVAAHLKSENITFKYIPINSDFEIEIQIDKVETEKRYSGAGLMFKENLSNDSKYYSIISSNKSTNFNTVFYKYNKDNYPNQLITGKSEYKNNILKIHKEANIIKAFSISDNGVHFNLLSIDTLNFTSGYIGVFFAGSDIFYKSIDTFLVSNLKINKIPIDFNKLNQVDIFQTNAKSRIEIKKEIHTNFKLNLNQDNVFLWNAENKLVDKINYTKQLTNLTYSRFPDGNNKLVFSSPTPNLTNVYSYDSIISPPRFSDHSIIGKTLSKIEIYHDLPEVEIYYTLDGSEPTKNSYFYQNQILLDSSVVIRAKAFLNDAISEHDVSFTYQPEINSNIPTMSLIIDTNFLYNKETGIFIDDNIFKNIEIPIIFNYVDENLSFNSNCGLKLHGQGSLGVIQKSFRLISRNIYEEDLFDYSFWDNNKSNKFQTINLKNGGNDWNNTMLRDIYIHVLAKNYIDNLIFTNQKYVSTYINNSFYGIHILREKIDENLLSEKFKVPTESFNILKDERDLISGDMSNYFQIIDNIIESDSINDFYKYFDINNFSNYLFIRFFSSIIDWPGRNSIVWQCQDIDQIYRYSLHDFDRSLYNEVYSHYTKNMFLHLKEFDSPFAKLFNKIKNHSSFQRELSNTFADNLNLKFSKENTEIILDSLIKILEPNISIQTKKYPNSLEFFNEQILRMKLFLSERPHYMFKHIVEEFNQTGTTEITLSQNIDKAGMFHLNNIDIYDSVWTGKYFNEIPINISVKSNPGYKFIGWENTEIKDSILTDINILELNQFRANFVQIGEPINSNSKILVINEIMYKPADNMKCEDWIELHNNSNKRINLTSYTLTDKNNYNIYTIPENTTIEAYDYLVIAQDVLKFRSYYGIAKNVIGDFDFGFGEEDAVRLYDYNNNLIDEVYYSNNNPWDSGADNTGFSLELIHPNYDNSLAQNWKASASYSGTPLEVNSQFITNVESKNKKVLAFPNPVEDYFTIYLHEQTKSKIIIYDILGNTVLSLNTNQSVINIDFSEYLSGFYVINIYNNNDDLISTSKIIKK